MLDRLYSVLLEHCLVAGQTSPLGWGRCVQDHVLPLLDHVKLRHHQGILRDGFQRAAEPVSVFVIGEGKFGKSSVINALHRPAGGKGGFLARHLAHHALSRLPSCPAF